MKGNNTIPARQPPLRQGIDHLLFGAADLASGAARATDLLGVAPTAGGRHPGQGTENALLALQGGCYFEVIAPTQNDPSTSPIRAELETYKTPGLFWWCWRPDNLENARARLSDAGIPVSQIISGSRTAPDGKTLSWRLVFLQTKEFGRALPFLIDWRDTEHPSSSGKSAGHLETLTLAHPDAPALRSLMGVIGAENCVDVTQARHPQITARITRCDATTVEITSPRSTPVSSAAFS